MWFSKKEDIVVVEDSSIIVKGYKHIFGEKNIKFYNTYSDLITITDVSEYNSKLFILDHHVYDSYTALDFIIHLKEIGSTIPCIVFTSRNEDELIKELYSYDLVKEVIIKNGNNLVQEFKKIKEIYG